ncbi:unnamed protein product [Closterium sp. NIES-64]|nr:unnamed protein product [Closterium sp. NIES-64]
MSNQSLHLLCRISNESRGPAAPCFPISALARTYPPSQRDLNFFAGNLLLPRKIRRLPSLLPVALPSRRAPFPSPSLPLCLPSRRLPFPSPTLPVARASVPSPSVRLVPLPSARPLLSPSISLPVAHAFPVNSLSVALAFPVISLSVAHAFPVALPSTARRPRLPSRLPSHLAHKSPYVFPPYSLLSLPLIIAFLPPPFPSSPCPLPFFPMSPSLLPHVPFPSSPCPLPFFPMSPSLLPHVPFPSSPCPLPFFPMSPSLLPHVPFPSSPCPLPFFPMSPSLLPHGLLARRPTLLNPDISRALMRAPC